MAFPSNTGSKPLALADAWVQARQIAGEAQRLSSGTLPSSRFDANGERQFDSTALAGFRTQLSALIAPID